MKSIYFLIIALFIVATTAAQSDSLSGIDDTSLLSQNVTMADTANQLKTNENVTTKIAGNSYFIKDYKERNSPKRAGMYSALLPGLGQAYNQQYWKIPIVYGAIGTGAVFIIVKNKQYNSFRKELAVRLSTSGESNPDLAYLNELQLERGMKAYKQELDLSVLLTAVGYLLQIMDAVAANHLKGFDISPDISMNIISKPMNENYNSLGLGVAFQFK